MKAGMVPGLQVIRPADAAEVVAVWHRLAADATAPAVLALSRQAVPQLQRSSPATLVADVARGIYAVRAVQHPDAAVIATGSEVQLALEAAAVLAADGVDVAVFSAPCLEWHEALPAAERTPLPAVPTLVVEAGVAGGWWRYAHDVVSIERFGEPGPGAAALNAAGITVEAVVDRVRRLVAAV